MKKHYLLTAAFAACALIFSACSSGGGSGSGGGDDTGSTVTSVTLNRSTLNVFTGTTATLTATVTTTDETTAKTVTWTTSDSAVVTVSNGTVTALAAGEATITATSTADSSKRATCTVTVAASSGARTVLWRADEYEAQNYTADTELGIMTIIGATLTLDGNSKSIDGYSFTKRLKLSGAGSITSKAISFTTTDSATVTVYYISGASSTSRTLILSDNSGTQVTSGTNNGNEIGKFATTSAIDAGQYYLYSSNGGINIYAVKIEYEESTLVYPESITLDQTSLSLDLATSPSATLTATISNATEVTSGYDTINWYSSDPLVATVNSSGVVTGIKAGNAIITAQAEYGTAEATCSVSVSGTQTADIVVVPGASITTNGWADRANNGTGMSYPDTTNIIYVGDDGYKVGDGSLTAYTSSLTKRVVFTNAIASGSVNSSSVSTTAAIIVVSGTVDLGDGVISDSDHSYYDKFDSATHARLHGDITYNVGSNKAIIGVNSAKLAYGGLIIAASNATSGQNIIIRNINFWDAHGSTEVDTGYDSSSKASADSLVLEAGGASSGSYSYIPKNIWIDHCEFSDGVCSDLTRNYHHDGSLDMKAGKYVTVSYCNFYNHDKVTLLAPNESYTPKDERQITFHHNYYHDAIQRMPRSRGCEVHIYNNYYNNIGTSGNGGYTLGPGINSQYIVENNYFGSWYTSSCLVKYFDGTTSASGATLSKFYQSGNNVTISNSNVSYDSAEKLKDFDTNHSTTTKPWTIEYNYSPASASTLPTLIPSAAGVDKTGYSKVIKVNGTIY